MKTSEAVALCAKKLYDYRTKVSLCTNRLLEYRDRIAKLTLAMEKELAKIQKQIEDTERTKIIYIERDRTTKTENYRLQKKDKYRTIDSFGKVTYFATKRELMDSLDITDYELSQHLNGKFTVLDDLQITVEKLR